MRDRRLTPALLRLLEDPGLPEGAARVVAEGLIDLGDVRAEVTAWRLLRDRSATPDRRRAAAGILDELGVLPPGRELLEWWDCGDLVLAEVALEQAHLGTARMVREALADPGRRAAAIETLGHGFDTREWTDLVVAALGDDDPDVRSAAIGSCLFTEPHRALNPLLVATLDDDPDLVAGALDVLRWYGSRAALRRAAQLRSHPSDGVRTAALDAMEHMLGDIELALADASPQARELVAAWLAPVADLLADGESAPADRVGSPVPSWAPAPSLTRLRQQLADPNGAWPEEADLFPEWVDWGGVPPRQRAEYAQFLAGHSDPEVRARGCAALAAWDRADLLAQLAADHHDHVAALARYRMHDLPRRHPELARLLWLAVDPTHPGDLRGGVQPAEALEAWTRHADPTEAQSGLADLARSDARVEVRYRALGKLRPIPRDLLTTALDPADPEIGWELTCAVLWDLDHPIPADQAAALLAVDDLDLACAVAENQALAILEQPTPVVVTTPRGRRLAGYVVDVEDSGLRLAAGTADGGRSTAGRSFAEA